MASFTLNTSTLAGALEQTDNPFDERGRALQLTWEQSGVNQDMEVYGYAVRYAPGEDQTIAGQSAVFVAADYAYIETPIEDRGRALELTWEQGGADQDMEIFGYAVRYKPAETEQQEAS